MYAITTTGYRAVSVSDELMPGEQFVDEIPASLWEYLAAVEVRSQRNSMLRSSDWTQLPDASLTSVQRDEWSVYRQALRDLPEHPQFPNMPWPSPPSLSGGEATETPPPIGVD